VTTPGKAIPIRSGGSNWSTSSPTALTMCFTDDGCGVATRTRSWANVPVPRSTGAPLMPEPPMSMPRIMVRV
jgi:hypothetical protein